nr:hypothetical protein [bacterium]
LEKNLGRKVVNRTRGGDSRGGTELTPFGRRFLEAYERYQAEVDRAARAGFQRFLGSGWDREDRAAPGLRSED